MDDTDSTESGDADSTDDTRTDLESLDDERFPLWRVLRAYGGPYRGRLAVGLASSVAARWLELVPALLVAAVVDGILLDAGPFALPLVPAAVVPATELGQLRLAVGLLVAATLATAVCHRLHMRGLYGFALGVQHDLRTDAFDRTQRQELAFFDDVRTGQLTAALSNDAQQLEEFLVRGLKDGLELGLLVVGIGVVLALTNPALAAVALVPVPLITGFTYLWGDRFRERHEAVRERVGRLNDRLGDALGAPIAVKTATAERRERDAVADASRGYRDATLDVVGLIQWFVPAVRLFGGLGLALVLAVGGWWVLRGAPGPLAGSLTGGGLVLFVMYTKRLVWPLAQFGPFVDRYEEARATARRLVAVLDREPRVDDGDVRLPDPDGRVAYEDVTFSYDGDDPAVDGVSLTVEAGDFVGVVGPTGAGKSTLLKLLPRLYDPDSGTVRLDGHDVRELRLADLRDAVGVVPQDPTLFSGTVRENVAYGSPDADRAAVERAARAADAHGFVEDLPDGYDTEVGEDGVKLSGGQRQRVALARVLLQDPAVLVLDEATSDVDTETEARIQRNLDAYTSDRTTFAVAHRLSTVREADTILVVDDGAVVEAGTHDELLDRDGLYATLWRIQTGETVTDTDVERVLTGD